MGFFFALSAIEEQERHRQARKLLETLENQTLSAKVAGEG